MRTFQELDAWKVSHELVLATYRLTKPLEGSADAELAYSLRRAGLRATSLIARGAGTGRRRMFAACVDTAAGYLAEYAYQLRFAKSLGLLAVEPWQELDALRGRAAFYTWKLYLGLAIPSKPDPPSDEG